MAGNAPLRHGGGNRPGVGRRGSESPPRVLPAATNRRGRGHRGNRSDSSSSYSGGSSKSSGHSSAATDRQLRQSELKFAARAPAKITDIEVEHSLIVCELPVAIVLDETLARGKGRS